MHGKTRGHTFKDAEVGGHRLRHVSRAAAPLCTAGRAHSQGCKRWSCGRSSLLRTWGSGPSAQSLFVYPAELPEDCHQLFLAGQHSSGVFQVQPSGSQPFKVYCDMTAGKAGGMSHSAFCGGLAADNPQ